MSTVNVHVGPFTALRTETADIPGGDPDAGKTTLQRLGGYARTNNTPTGFLQNSDTNVDAIQVNKIAQGLSEILDWSHTTDDSITSIEADITTLQGASSSGGVLRINATQAPYNCVADGTAANVGSSTDNKAGIEAALAVIRAAYDAGTLNGGAELYFPAKPGKRYHSYYTDVSTGTTAGYIGITIPGLRIVGDGPDVSVIQGVSDKRTPRGQVASIDLVGNTFTMVTHSDAARVKQQCGLHFSPNSDGTGMRSNSQNVNASANGNSSTGVVTIYVGGGHAAGLSAVSGLVVGDYVYVDYGFTIFKHLPQADATTVAYNCTWRDIGLIGENYGATLDLSSNVDSGHDTNTACVYLEPRGATTTVTYRTLFDNVKISGAYNGILQTAAGSNSWARSILHIRNSDLTGFMVPVYAGCDPNWAEKWFIAENTTFHDTDPTKGSHLNYIEGNVNLQIDRCRYLNFRSSKYGIQHWGTSNVSPRHVSVTDSYFYGDGTGIITNEHGTFDVSGCTFDVNLVMQIRTSTTMRGGRIWMRDSGTGLITYADCQSNCHITIEGVEFNDVAVTSGGTSGHIVVDHPVFMTVANCHWLSIDASQSTSALPVAGNKGYFLVVHSGSEGGHVQVINLQANQDQVSSSSFAQLAQLNTGADVTLRGNRVKSRVSVTGNIRIDGRTAGKVHVQDNDINTSGPGGGSAPSSIYGSATTAVDILTGWGNKFNGTKCTFSTNRQKLRGRQDTGPDIASAGTIVWDPDFDEASVTGTTLISTMNVTGSSQLGWHGLTAKMYSPSGWSTDALGNFAAAYTVPAGGYLIVSYNANAAKWVKVGGT